MKTLNQLIYLLTGFFESHAQINQSCYEDDFNFNAERKLSYPDSNIEYLESNISGKTTSHLYQVTLADLYSEDIKGHADEIQSDLMLVAEDFFAWAQEQNDFTFQRSVNIQKFTDDRTAGLTFRVQLMDIRSQNKCAIPLK